MKLGQLIKECRDEDKGIEVENLCFDSSKVVAGSLFFCMKGTKKDGHLYAYDAWKKGAVALVVEYPVDIDLPQVIVKNIRSVLAKASAKFYKNPAKQLKMIGLTGTNGKTTTSYILQSIFNASGKKCGLIGTNAIVFDKYKFDANLTTPDPTELHYLLRLMVDSGVEYVIMEVSAHALALNKVDGIVFDVSAFTNFSRDHLDFFKDMNEYFSAKKILFTKNYSKNAVVNVDDARGKELALLSKIPTFTYGCQNPADAFAIDLSMSVDGLEYVLNLNDDVAKVKFNMSGKFNMYNTLCAASVASVLGIHIKDIVEGIRTLKKVDGRFNIINTSKCGIIIDFAHTDDGLDNILTAIKEFAPKKVITVFGCGGDRDREKRPKMGNVVSKKSDYVYITSDNPRSENPLDIINDVAKGIEKSKQDYCFLVEDRQKAILQAVEFAQDGDIVLIAGKGAEKFQEINGIKHPYNDEEYIMKLIEEKKI